MLTKYWWFWGVNVLAALLVFFVFILGWKHETITAPNIPAWCGILAVVPALLVGSLRLRAARHPDLSVLSAISSVTENELAPVRPGRAPEVPQLSPDPVAAALCRRVFPPILERSSFDYLIAAANTVRARTFSLRLPVAIRYRCTDCETGLALAMAIELFGEPLEPFPAFLRAGPGALHLYERLKPLPGDPRHPTDEIIRDRQRNDARENRVTDSLHDRGNFQSRFQTARIILDLCRRSAFRNRGHQHRRTHPLRRHERLDRGKSGPFLALAPGPAHFNQAKGDPG